VIEGHWKLVYTPCSDFARYSLYDCKKDPEYTTDVLEAHPTVAADLKQRLAGWMNVVSGPRPHIPRSPHGDGTGWVTSFDSSPGYCSAAPRNAE
jgi:hypothetical protein